MFRLLVKLDSNYTLSLTVKILPLQPRSTFHAVHIELQVHTLLARPFVGKVSLV